MIAIDPRQGCCACVSERISELLDGELDEAVAPRVAMHLATCADCHRIACELARVVAAVHGLAARPLRAGVASEGAPAGRFA